MNKDLGNKILCKVSEAMKKSNLEVFTKRIIVSIKTIIAARIYFSRKIHKEGVPLRPIVNTIGLPTYLLVKYLARKLAPLTSSTSLFVKDSIAFMR